MDNIPNNRYDYITKIIELTKKYDKDKFWYEDAIKRNYYKDDSLNNIRMKYWDYMFMDNQLLNSKYMIKIQ